MKTLSKERVILQNAMDAQSPITPALDTSPPAASGAQEASAGQTDWYSPSCRLLALTEQLADIVALAKREEQSLPILVLQINALLAERDHLIAHMQSHPFEPISAPNRPATGETALKPGASRPLREPFFSPEPNPSDPYKPDPKPSPRGVMSLESIFHCIQQLEVGIRQDLNELLTRLGSQLQRTTHSRRKMHGYRIAPSPIELQTDGQKA